MEIQLIPHSYNTVDIKEGKKKTQRSCKGTDPHRLSDWSEVILQMLHNSRAIVISICAQLHLICIVIAELERKIREGGLKATRCVNSPGLRHSLPIHLGILCHLQAVCMRAACKTVKDWLSESAALLAELKEKKKGWCRCLG